MLTWAYWLCISELNFTCLALAVSELFPSNFRAASTQGVKTTHWKDVTTVARLVLFVAGKWYSTMRLVCLRWL
jgi:hypothetical protein